MKKAIYTALFNNYDTFKDPLYINKDYEYYLFTDQNIKSKVYTVIKMKGTVRTAREIKLRPHKFLPGCNFTIWHDASMQQKSNLNSLIKSDNFDIITMKHPDRNCIYKEFEACSFQGKDDHVIMSRQMTRYNKEKYPKNNGLIASGVILRHNVYKVRLFCEYWFKELKNGSVRDQLSFNYVLHKMPLKIHLLPYAILKTHFNHKKHNKN